MELLDVSRLRARVARLCSLPRESASSGEREAARQIAGELARLGWYARLDPELVHGTLWWPLGLLNALGAAAGVAGRRLGVALGALAAAGLTDELWIGRRWFRSRLPRRRTLNLSAAIGPPGAPTLVLHAHHDAAHTGLAFRPELSETPGRLLQRSSSPGRETAPPMGWAMPIAAALAGAGPRRLRRPAAAVSALIAALMADVGRGAVVPGANDNASGVVALLSLARALAADPPRRLRVVLLSTGSEESPLEGMQAWMRRHRPARGTVFLCLDGLASQRLVVADGEGMLKLHRYPREPTATMLEAAEELGIEVGRFSFRFATDGQIPLRGGYPAAALSSVDANGAPRNYHLPSDDPEHADYDTLRDATRLALALVRRLDR